MPGRAGNNSGRGGGRQPSRKDTMPERQTGARGTNENDAATHTEKSFAQTGAWCTNDNDAATRTETSFAQAGASGTNTEEISMLRPLDVAPPTEGFLEKTRKKQLEDEPKMDRLSVPVSSTPRKRDAAPRTEMSSAQTGASGTNTRESPFLDLEIAGVADESDSDYDYRSDDENVAVETADEDIADTVLQTQDEEINFQFDPLEADADDVPEEAKSATRSGRPVRMRTQRAGRTRSNKENFEFFVEASRKIEAVLTLGTVQRRAIERHAQQDIGKAKVKERYMEASD